MSPRPLGAVRLPQECGGTVAFVNADARGKTACIRPGQRRVVPPPFGSVGGNVSIIAQVSFIFPSRYSVLALLVLTSPLVSTTKRNEGRTLRPFCVSRISVTYAKYAPSSSHLKRRTRGPRKVPEQALRARTLYGVSSHPLIAFGKNRVGFV